MIPRSYWQEVVYFKGVCLCASNGVKILAFFLWKWWRLDCHWVWRRKTLSKLQILPFFSGVSLCFFQLLTVVLQGYFVQLEFILALLQERNLVKLNREDDRIASNPRCFFAAKTVTSDTECPLWMYKVHGQYLAILLANNYCWVLGNLPLYQHHPKSTCWKNLSAYGLRLH